MIHLLVILLAACQSIRPKENNLFEDLGELDGITRIIDIFIYEIGETRQVLHHFEDTDIDRFREKQIEHLCVLAGGPCEYTGDDMLKVHQGMNISEADFNAMTNALIRALDQADVSISDRNRLLAIIASMHSEVIYK
jgi:hemoglobin